MQMGVEGAQAAWAHLAQLPSLDGVQVVVDPDSRLAPRGWIGIVVIGSTITASVPRGDLEAPVSAALVGLDRHEATTPEVVTQRLPPTSASMGPAVLFYPPVGFSPDGGASDEASKRDLEVLLAAVIAADLDESGMAHLESPTFVSRLPDGKVAGASGYRRWPNGVAHLSVLTHPAHRRQGHGKRASSTAIRRAMDEELLPQWRARPIESQMLAMSVGLVAVGAQLSLQPR